MLCFDITYLSMFLFLLPSNIEQMCLKVLFEMPGEIKKTGTDKLDLLSFFLPSTPLPLEDTSSATLDSRQKTLSCLRKGIQKPQKCLHPSFIFSDQETQWLVIEWLCEIPPIHYRRLIMRCVLCCLNDCHLSFAQRQESQILPSTSTDIPFPSLG